MSNIHVSWASEGVFFFFLFWYFVLFLYAFYALLLRIPAYVVFINSFISKAAKLIDVLNTARENRREGKQDRKNGKHGTRKRKLTFKRRLERVYYNHRIPPPLFHSPPSPPFPIAYTIYRARLWCRISLRFFTLLLLLKPCWERGRRGQK